MSVETGIAPQSLVELDGPTFEAVVEAADRRWTVETELAAQSVELGSALLVAYLNVHSGKKRSTLEPVQVPRPAALDAELELDVPASTRKVSGLELAGLAGKPITQAVPHAR